MRLPVLDAARLVGSQLHERSDRAPRTAERVVLQRVPEGEQEEQGGAFQPVADDPRPGCREQHQQIHVERGSPQRSDGPSTGLPPARDVCEQQEGQRGLGHAEGGQREAKEQGDATHERGQRAPAPAFLVAVFVRIAAAAHHAPVSRMILDKLLIRLSGWKATKRSLCYLV